MAYNLQLAEKIRTAFMGLPDVEEKNMFGGVCFMLQSKMCVGVVGDEMMCRIDPDIYEAQLQRPGCRPMDFSGKSMMGYTYVSGAGLEDPEFPKWIAQCIAYNPKAKAAKKKASKTK
jgi:TfoX/Sxy family transcriptional regulator of competence genes